MSMVRLGSPFPYIHVLTFGDPPSPLQCLVKALFLKLTVVEPIKKAAMSVIEVTVMDTPACRMAFAIRSVIWIY